MAKTLYTAWYDYFGTGEGRTLAALVALASDETEMRSHVARQFDEFSAVLATIAPGVVRNDVTQRLWPQSLFEFLERCEGDAGAVMAKCQLHANFG